MSDRIKNIILTICFSLVLGIVFISNLVIKDKDISESERRKYQMFPKFSLDRVFNGTFTSQLDNYAMDQFMFREDLRKLKTMAELKFFNKKDVRNVYEYNGYLLKQEYPLNEKSVLNICKKMKDIDTKYLNETNRIFYTIVPDKNYFVNDEYLKLDYDRIKTLMQEQLSYTYIDIMDELKLEDYYYTDTHWKQENLEGVLNKITSEMGIKDRITTPFEKEDLGTFKGVYTGQLQVSSNEDRICILTNDIIEKATATNYETKEITSIYDLSKLDGLDKYDLFLSGATPLITIENKEAKETNELVVFRDSFGSSIIPLLTEGYSKITVVDTRYISPLMLGDIVNFENADVLFLYSTLVINSSGGLK